MTTPVSAFNPLAPAFFPRKPHQRYPHKPNTSHSTPLQPHFGPADQPLLTALLALNTTINWGPFVDRSTWTRAYRLAWLAKTLPECALEGGKTLIPAYKRCLALLHRHDPQQRLSAVRQAWRCHTKREGVAMDKMEREQREMMKMVLKSVTTKRLGLGLERVLEEAGVEAPSWNKRYFVKLAEGVLAADSKKMEKGEKAVFRELVMAWDIAPRLSRKELKDIRRQERAQMEEAKRLGLPLLFDEVVVPSDW